MIDAHSVGSHPELEEGGTGNGCPLDPEGGVVIWGLGGRWVKIAKSLGGLMFYQKESQGICWFADLSRHLDIWDNYVYM